ncbi:MAG TPA: PEGA domain-containing protein [Polyangiaceae bacterium]
MTRVTAFLGVGGALALLAAIVITLITGCGPAPVPAVTLKLVRSPETPRDASVIIDEEYIGPLGIVAARGVRIPLGEHRISVEKTGYFPYDKLVVSDRDDVKLDVKLERVPD